MPHIRLEAINPKLPLSGENTQVFVNGNRIDGVTAMEFSTPTRGLFTIHLDLTIDTLEMGEEVERPKHVQEVVAYQAPVDSQEVYSTKEEAYTLAAQGCMQRSYNLGNSWTPHMIKVFCRLKRYLEWLDEQ